MRPHALSSALAAALVAAAGQPAALGSVLNWNNAGGGLASTGSNWNPSAVPAPADSLVYNLNATYLVSFDAATAASTTQVFKKGVVTLDLAAPHTTSAGITIGDASGDTASATLRTGVWNSSSSIVVGNAAGSSGTSTIDADVLLASGSGISNGTGNLIVGRPAARDRAAVAVGGGKALL